MSGHPAPHIVRTTTRPAFRSAAVAILFANIVARLDSARRLRRQRRADAPPLSATRPLSPQGGHQADFGLYPATVQIGVLHPFADHRNLRLASGGGIRQAAPGLGD